MLVLAECFGRAVRLFVAVPLDEAVRRAAAGLLDECRRRVSGLAPGARITWVAPERLHITVRFIGSVDEVRGAAIRDALTPPLPIASFECEIAGTGSFPGRGQPRVVWAGVADGRAELVALEREVSERLAGVGIEPEARMYSPHVTLGRVREAAGLRADRLLDGLTPITLGRMAVSEATLFESRLSPLGPTYVPLLELPLGTGIPGRQ